MNMIYLAHSCSIDNHGTRSQSQNLRKSENLPRTSLSPVPVATQWSEIDSIRWKLANLNNLLRQESSHVFLMPL